MERPIEYLKEDYVIRKAIVEKIMLLSDTLCVVFKEECSLEDALNYSHQLFIEGNNVWRGALGRGNIIVNEFKDGMYLMGDIIPTLNSYTSGYPIAIYMDVSLPKEEVDKLKDKDLIYPYIDKKGNKLYYIRILSDELFKDFNSTISITSFIDKINLLWVRATPEQLIEKYEIVLNELSTLPTYRFTKRI